MEHFKRFPSQLWNVGSKILSGLNSLNHTLKAFWSFEIVSTNVCPQFKQNNVYLMMYLTHSLWMWESLSTQVHSMVSHYQLGNPVGECIFRHAVKGSHWLKVKLHKGHTTGSEVIQNGWIFSRGTTFTYTNTHTHIHLYMCVCVSNHLWR